MSSFVFPFPPLPERLPEGFDFFLFFFVSFAGGYLVFRSYGGRGGVSYIGGGDAASGARGGVRYNEGRKTLSFVSLIPPSPLSSHASRRALISFL